MKDAMGDRFKKYESISSYRLPSKSYFIVRLDGKGFSKWTKKLNKPFDHDFAEDMVETAKYLCANLQGAKLAFYQSDEISILFTDFESNVSQQLYDGKIQKITSISASMATAYFNKLRIKREVLKSSESPDMFFGALDSFIPGMFDSRVFSISDPNEVMNYFLWRQNDTTRNSISMAAHKYLGHKECEGKNSNEKQEMIFQKSGINWNDYDVVFKRGQVIKKESYEKNGADRTRWNSFDPPILTEDWSFLADLIPIYSASLFEEGTTVEQ